MKNKLYYLLIFPFSVTILYIMGLLSTAPIANATAIIEASSSSFIFASSVTYAINIPALTGLGQLSLNTTAASTSLRIYDGTATRSFYNTRDVSGVFASSSVYNGTGAFANGTTTIIIRNPLRPTTMTRYFCKTNAGTVNIRFGTGSASTTMAICTVAGTETSLSSNNTWTMRQNLYIDIGTQSGTDYVTPTFTLREDSD